MCMRNFAALCKRKRRPAKGSGCEPGGVFMSVVASSLEAVAEQQMPGVMGRQRRGAGLQPGLRHVVEKLLHLQITSTSSPRTAESQGVRRWHLLHTEPGAATLGEQEKVMTWISPSPGALQPCALPTC